MGGCIGVIPVKIPNKCASFENFVAQISHIEDNLEKIDFVKCLSNKNEVLCEISICEE